MGKNKFEKKQKRGNTFFTFMCYIVCLKTVEVKKMTKKICVLGVLFLIALGVGFANGGGGVYYGQQVAQYPFFENYDIDNNSLGLIYYGGFGYGIDKDDIIKGGFGMTIYDPSGVSGIAGGFGGVIAGVRLLKLPLNISIVSYTGFGGLYTGNHKTSPGSGFFAVSGELDLEVGVPIFKWFMPVVYAGYQVQANVIPGKIFEGFLSYTPVVGVKMTWGSLY